MSPGSGFPRYRKRFYSGDGPFVPPVVSVISVGIFPPGMDSLCPLLEVSVNSVRVVPSGLDRFYPLFFHHFGRRFFWGDVPFASPG